MKLYDNDNPSLLIILFQVSNYAQTISTLNKTFNYKCLLHCETKLVMYRSAYLLNIVINNMHLFC